MGHSEEALDSYRSVREVYARLGDRLRIADCDFNAGATLGVLGRHHEALESLSSAREALVGLGERRRLAQCDFGAGVVLNELGRHHEALDSYRSARRAYAALGERRQVAACDLNGGNVLADLGRHHDALASYGSARAAYEDLEGRRSVAICDFDSGNTLGHLGRNAEALEPFRSARAAYIDLGDRRTVADCDYSIGIALTALGRRGEALEPFRSARAAYIDLEDRPRIAHCDYSIGNALARLGYHEGALASFRQALPVLEESGGEDVVASCREQVQVTLQVALADDERRLAAVQENEQVCAREGRTLETAAARLDAAWALRALGRPKEALEELRLAQPVYDEAGLTLQSAGLNEELGLAYNALGRHGEAAASYRAAADAYDEAGAQPDLRIEAWGAAKAAHEAAGQVIEAAQVGQALGEALHDAGRHHEALDASRLSARGFAGQGQALEAARSQMGEGHALTDLDRHEEALRVLAQAESALDRFDQDLEVVRCRLLRGAVLGALGQYEEAEQLLGGARPVLEAAQQHQEVADCDLALAWIHLSQGRAELALADVARAEPGLDAELDLAAAALVRARALLALGRAEEAFEAAHGARRRFLDAHLGLRAAVAEEALAQAHLGMAEQASTGREAARQRQAALERALRAVGVLDAHRYQLEEPRLRSSWTARAQAGAYARAFSLAHDQRNWFRVAQLVESARVQGLPVRRESTIWTALGPGAAATPESAAESSSPDEETSARAEALAQAGEPVPLGAPAAVVLAGTPPLAEEAARRRVALEHVVVQAGGEGAWWWGMWVVGDACYWSLVGPPATGVVEAGAVPMADLGALLARLDQALPQRLGMETDDQALARAQGGAMADRSSEAALAAELGSVLLPEPLRRRLLEASKDQPLSLVVAPAHELGRVPFALLGLDGTGDPLRLGERAVVRLGVSAALLGAVSTREQTRPGGAPGGKARVLSVMDPGGQGLFGYGKVPGAWGQVLSRPENQSALAAQGFAPAVATKQALARHLGQDYDVVVFMGHAQPGPADSPVDAHLVLWDQVVSARDWLYEPERWAMPARVGLVACGSGGAESPEWLGLAPAALSAGARVVMATAWNLPNDNPAHTWALTDQVVRVLRDGEDPAASWRECFLHHLRSWRRGQDNALSPLLWGAVQVVGLAS
jgi:tetratricopeptide (TPR) repeat protein